MTKIYHEEKGDEILISAQGHTDSRVCNAVSVLLDTLAIRLHEVSKNTHREAHSGYLYLRAQGRFVRPAYDTIMCGIRQLAEQYPKDIELIEGCPIFDKEN